MRTTEAAPAGLRLERIPSPKDDRSMCTRAKAAPAKKSRQPVPDDDRAAPENARAAPAARRQEKAQAALSEKERWHSMEDDEDVPHPAAERTRWGSRARWEDAEAVPDAAAERPLWGSEFVPWHSRKRRSPWAGEEA